VGTITSKRRPAYPAFTNKEAELYHELSTSHGQLMAVKQLAAEQADLLRLWVRLERQRKLANHSGVSTRTQANELVTATNKCLA
jgi:hypothetical protein